MNQVTWAMGIDTAVVGSDMTVTCLFSITGGVITQIHQEINRPIPLAPKPPLGPCRRPKSASTKSWHIQQKELPKFLR